MQVMSALISQVCCLDAARCLPQSQWGVDVVSPGLHAPAPAAAACALLVLMQPVQ